MQGGKLGNALVEDDANQQSEDKAEGTEEWREKLLLLNSPLSPHPDQPDKEETGTRMNQTAKASSNDKIKQSNQQEHQQLEPGHSN